MITSKSLRTKKREKSSCMLTSMAAQQIIIRQVWAQNLVIEFNLIHQALSQFPIVSMDTEFPGTVFNPFANAPKHLLTSLTPPVFYSMMKQNVDALKLIQLGITLSDADGNLPHFGNGVQFAWQFNFRNFDPKRDLHNPESISLLKRQGIDFAMNKRYGVHSRDFALLFNASGLGFNSVEPGKYRRRNLTWITFHGPYDFGFLIKVLTGRRLLDDINKFLELVQHFFGKAVYDLKPMTGAFRLYGGLERVAKSLKVERTVGNGHQAGSDSLLIMQAFVATRKTYFEVDGVNMMNRFSHKIHGLT